MKKMINIFKSFATTLKLLCLFYPKEIASPGLSLLPGVLAENPIECSVESYPNLRRLLKQKKFYAKNKCIDTLQ